MAAACPPWLATRMSSLGAIITQAIVHHYGRDEFLQRLSHPFWFQSFGAVMGMDWHSSGITTSVIGALKRGLAPLQDELGIHVCGGRGKHSRKTPDELTRARRAHRLRRRGLDARQPPRRQGRQRRRAGRLRSLSARLLRHRRRQMDGRAAGHERRQAAGPPLSLAFRKPGQLRRRAAQRDRRPGAGRDRQSDRPARRALARGAARLAERARARIASSAICWRSTAQQPAHSHCCRISSCRRTTTSRSSDVFTRRLHGTLAAAAERGPVDFPELLLTPGVGARTVRSLAMVAEVVHGAPYRFRDPARFSLAHGGKDRHPYPVPIKVYDETIRVLKSAVQNAKLGRDEEMQALKRLDDQARRLERTAHGPSLRGVHRRRTRRLARRSTAARYSAGKPNCHRRRPNKQASVIHRIWGGSDHAPQ